MSMTETTRHLPFGAVTAHRVAQMLHDLHTRYTRWADARRTLGELRRLDVRALEDIGLTPADLDTLERTRSL